MWRLYKKPKHYCYINIPEEYIIKQYSPYPNIIDLTEEGDVLFEIDFKYDGEPFVWRKFMHLKSFLRFYKHRKAKYLDSHSEKFITNYR